MYQMSQFNTMHILMYIVSSMMIGISIALPSTIPSSKTAIIDHEDTIKIDVPTDVLIGRRLVLTLERIIPTLVLDINNTHSDIESTTTTSIAAAGRSNLVTSLKSLENTDKVVSISAVGNITHVRILQTTSTPPNTPINTLIDSGQEEFILKPFVITVPGCPNGYEHDLAGTCRPIFILQNINRHFPISIATIRKVSNGKDKNIKNKIKNTYLHIDNEVDTSSVNTDVKKDKVTTGDKQRTVPILEEPPFTLWGRTKFMSEK